MIRFVAVFVAVLVALLPAAASGSVAVVPALHPYVADQRAQHGFPGLALAVVEGGRVVDTAGFGGAGDDRPMSGDTPMNIGSITKTVTAVAILQLVERGAVDLDAPVRRYLPWFAVDDPVASEAITVRHLLHHTSGLSELETGGPGTMRGGATPQDAVRALRSVALSAPVGTRYQYLNVGYTALALVVEAASGRTYPEFVAENVFVPLGMTRSSADPRDVARPDLAQGHSGLFGFAVPRATPTDLSQMGNGEVTSTAGDLARLLAALANGGEFDGVRVLSPASVAAMQTPPPGIAGAGYGFGWEVGTTGEDLRIGGHDGAAATSIGTVVLLRDTGRGFVLLANSEHLLHHWVGFAELTGGVTAVLAGREPPGGPPGRMIGLGLLSVFVVVLVVAVWDLSRLPRWRERSRLASRGRLLRDIAPHFVVPALLLVAVYAVVPQLLLGRPFTLGWTGSYFLPDVALILAVAIAADLLQGTYKCVVVTGRTARQRRSPTGSARAACTP